MKKLFGLESDESTELIETNENTLYNSVESLSLESEINDIVKEISDIEDVIAVAEKTADNIETSIKLDKVALESGDTTPTTAKMSLSSLKSVATILGADISNYNVSLESIESSPNIVISISLEEKEGFLARTWEKIKRFVAKLMMKVQQGILKIKTVFLRQEDSAKKLLKRFSNIKFIPDWTNDDENAIIEKFAALIVTVTNSNKLTFDINTLEEIMALLKADSTLFDGMIAVVEKEIDNAKNGKIKNKIKTYKDIFKKAALGKVNILDDDMITFIKEKDTDYIPICVVKDKISLLGLNKKFGYTYVKADVNLGVTSKLGRSIKPIAIDDMAKILKKVMLNKNAIDNVNKNLDNANKRLKSMVNEFEANLIAERAKIAKKNKEFKKEYEKEKEELEKKKAELEKKSKFSKWLNGDSKADDKIELQKADEEKEKALARGTKFLTTAYKLTPKIGLDMSLQHYDVIKKVLWLGNLMIKKSENGDNSYLN